MDKARQFVNKSARDVAMFHQFMDTPKPDVWAAHLALREHASAVQAFWHQLVLEKTGQLV